MIDLLTGPFADSFVFRAVHVVLRFLDAITQTVRLSAVPLLSYVHAEHCKQ